MEEFKSKFQAALEELNFKQRCNQLAKLGKEMKAAQPAKVQEILDSLLPEVDQASAGVKEAFTERARLIVAKAAGCQGYAKKLLDSPSKTVGFSAATGGLLKPQDARAAFLSSDTSRKMKKFLLQCDSLESDKEVLEHAFELFGEKDKEQFWPLLARSKSEELLEEYLEEDKPMRDWLSAKHSDKVPGLPQLARRFPAFMVKLVTNGALRWRWYWVTEILEQDPMPVLRATLVEMHTQGSGPKAGYCPSKKNQDFFSTLAHWGWRRKPEMMLQLVEEMTHKGTTGSGGQYVSKGRGKGMVLMKGAGRGRGRGTGGGDKDALPGVDQVIRLGGEIMSTHSTRHALTVNKKIALLMKIWAVLPQGHKKASVAQRFADLLPSFALDDHRQNEITNLINAFWTILSDVGRSDRQELLVGPLVATGGPNSEKKPTGCTEFLKLFTRRLPPPLAVEQFFKVLGEFEAGTPAYKFIQSDICKSSNGRHDELMKSVFKKYLLKEDEGPVKAAEMFKVLLADARSRDVIQTSFDTLTEHLEGYSEIGLLQTVVQKMGSLEKQSRQKGTREITPEASLPVPIDWLQFLKLQEEAVPHVQFLLMVLHTGIGESELLGSMITKFGKIFFWDCLGHVLSAAQGKLVEQAIPAPVLGVLQGLNVKVMEEADKKAKAVTGVAASGKKRASKGSFGVGSAIFGLDGTKWGSVVADEGRAWKLDSGRIAKKETEGDKWTWAGGVSTKGDEGACKYFQTVADMKKKANVKDPSARLSGYSDLMTLAQKEKDAGKAFEDLLPFLLSRFNAEQEQGRSHILSELFVGKKLPDDLWEDKLEHLRNFWKVSSKARESSSYQCTWNKCGRQLVENALKNWGKPIKDGEEAPPYPTEACLFGLEVVSEIDLPELLVKSHSKIETLKDLENATRWALETAVPLSGEQSAPLEDFWKALKTMSTIKFCGEDPDAITSWRTEKSVKAHKEKSSTSPEVSVMEPGSVVRGVQRGNWLELINGQGFMLITSEKTGLPIMKQDSGNTGEKGLWETYPFVSEWWRKLLAGGVKQKAIDFVFVGVLNLLADRQQHFVAGDKKLSKRWWAPVECEEYKDAVTNILQHIESGVIPSKEGSAMITRRITALKNINIMTDLKWKVLATKRRERVEDRTQIQSSVGQALSQLPFRHLPATKWVEGESWDIQKHHMYTPLPWQTGRCKDSIAAQELDTINKLLQRPNRRQVLWQISEIAAMLSGPKITQLVEASIATLNARFEGMARTVGRHYPYLNSALTKNETLKGSCDVLTPLMELLLLDDPTRDACVAKLMERKDAEYLLLFGCSFGRHLSTVRQEWLHKCLCKLKANGEETEFFHYRNRGPMLSQIARYGKGDPGWRKALDNAKGAVQMYLWHPKTQTEFLKKALWSTEQSELTLIPRVEFADGVSRVSELLSIYPKDQTTKDSSDVWGWEVIQAAGAYSDINQEVERRFAELPEPSFCDKVDDPEVETLLSALGRSDNAMGAMKVLGPHAGKVKQAKEAVTKMISQLSPPQARVLIRQVMLPKKAGVGLQVAGLKKIVDLRIPDPLELYTYVWRKGECQRDVAGNILSKVATSGEFPPEDVRIYFEYFDRTDNQDDQAYVAQILLDQLIEQHDWVLPYLPKVVSKLAMVPGATQKSVQALKQCTSNVADVVQALTSILQCCRLAARTDPKLNKEGTDGRVLADLISLVSFSNFTDVVSCVGRMSLEECDSQVLKTFLQEVLRRWSDALTAKDSNARSCLSCALAVWVKLLRPSEQDVWAKEIAVMEQRLLKDGVAESLGQMAQALAGYAPDMGLSPDEWDVMLQTLRNLFVRLLDGPLEVNVPAAEGEKPADDTFKKENKSRETVRQELLLDHWAKLLSHGCTESESKELFKRCPEKSRVRLAQNLIDSWWKCQTAETERENKAAFQQERPDGGWKHTGGKPISQVAMGSIVSGTVTNSSATFGVYVNFGCEKDGKLSVPLADWKKYRVGDRVERMVVNKVNVERKFVDLLVVGSKGQSVGLEASKQVAKRALSWVASDPELRTTFMVTLQKMLAQILVAGGSEEFEPSLGLLGQPMDAKDSVKMAQLVLEQSPKVDLIRTTLTWLSKISPADAVRLWPQLIQSHKKLQDSGDDIKTLLTLCEQNGLELPKLSQAVYRDMPASTLQSLCSSSLPEARLAAIHVLREQHKTGAPPDELRALCGDPVVVVRASARDHWVALGGKDEGWQKKKDAENAEEEEEDDDA